MRIAWALWLTFGSLVVWRVTDAAWGGADLAALTFATVAGITLIVARSSRLRAGRWTALTAVMLMVCTLCGGSWMVSAAGERATADLRRTLDGIAPTYAAEMRARGHWQLHSEASADDPLYLDLIEAQKRWLAANPAVADVYTFRRSADGQWRLVVDSETDYDRSGLIDGEREQRTAIGEHYEFSLDQLNTAMLGQSVFTAAPETDRWGTWVSAFVPVYGAAGDVEAVLGVDFPADEWGASVSDARLSMIAYVAIILTIMGTAALLQIGYLRHINESARTGRILTAQAAELDEQNRELGNRAVGLARAKAAADDASRAKSDFLSNMSHEIRTPMTAILGYADLLGEGSPSDGEREDYVNIIRRNGEHLLELINGILDLSKIEAGKFAITPAPFVLGDVIAEVEATMRVKADAKGLALAVEHAGEAPRIVESDAFRLRQVLVNLVGNAIKFTDHGGVRMVVRCLAPVSSSADYPLRNVIAIDVIDTGIGMSTEQISQLFRPFTQVDSSMSRRYGGTGLGLAISKRLAGLLGGSLTVAAVPGEGSTFTLRFDAGNVADRCNSLIPPAATAPSDAFAAVTLTGRVLLAEDGPDNQRLIATLLRKAGAQVRVVENGRVAVDVALAATSAGVPFDLILLDMQMPELDGFGAARELRGRGVRTPIVALTAMAMESDRAACIAAGCDDYASKPLDRSILLGVCERWIRAGRESLPLSRAAA